MKSEIVENMTKGEFGQSVKNMDNSIKEIDYAFPMEWSKQVRALGINTDEYVWCYYKDGRIEPLNIVAHWAKLYTREG